MKASLASLGVVVALAASLWGGGCTTHGDGGRCDSRNGNSDCDNGLVCTHAQDILLPGEAGTVSQTDICCPQDRSTAPPGDICAFNPVTPGSEAGIPESGVDGSETDAASDVTSDQSTSDAADGATETDATDAASD